MTWPLTPGAKILTNTRIGTVWLIIDADGQELNWFKVNKKRFGYRVKCQKTRMTKKLGASIAAEIASIKYGAFKAEREVF